VIEEEEDDHNQSIVLHKRLPSFNLIDLLGLDDEVPAQPSPAGQDPFAVHEDKSQPGLAGMCCCCCLHACRLCCTAMRQCNVQKGVSQGDEVVAKVGFAYQPLPGSASC
jgi:hypothetical protein